MSKDLTIHFEHDEDAQRFADWLEGQGESDFYEWQSLLGQELVHFDYQTVKGHVAPEGLIIATRVK